MKVEIEQKTTEIQNLETKNAETLSQKNENIETLESLNKEAQAKIIELTEQIEDFHIKIEESKKSFSETELENSKKIEIIKSKLEVTIESLNSANKKVDSRENEIKKLEDKLTVQKLALEAAQIFKVELVEAQKCLRMARNLIKETNIDKEELRSTLQDEIEKLNIAAKEHVKRYADLIKKSKRDLEALENTKEIEIQQLTEDIEGNSNS